MSDLRKRGYITGLLLIVSGFSGSSWIKGFLCFFIRYTAWSDDEKNAEHGDTKTFSTCFWPQQCCTSA